MESINAISLGISVGIGIVSLGLAGFSVWLSLRVISHEHDPGILTSMSHLCG